MAIVAVSIAPTGEGPSVSRHVAAALAVVRAQDRVAWRLDPMFTTLEGDLDEIFALVRRMQEAVFDAGAVRVGTVMKIDDRRDRSASMVLEQQRVVARGPGPLLGRVDHGGAEPRDQLVAAIHVLARARAEADVVQADPALVEAVGAVGRVRRAQAEGGATAHAVVEAVPVEDRLQPEGREQLAVEGARPGEVRDRDEGVGDPVDLDVHGRAQLESRASRSPLNCQRASAGKKLR